MQKTLQRCLASTPAARVMDYIEQGKLSVAGVKFFVLDEADRLLDTGSQVLLDTLHLHTLSCMFGSVSAVDCLMSAIDCIGCQCCQLMPARALQLEPQKRSSIFLITWWATLPVRPCGD